MHPNPIADSFIVAGLIPVGHCLILKIFPEKTKAIKYAFTITMVSAFLSWLFLAQTSHGNDFFNGMCVLFFFMVGYTEFYSLLRRGYSLRILRELYITSKPLSEMELISQYSHGNGLDWFLKKRLSGLKRLNLIDFNDREIVLGQPWGGWFSKLVYLALRLFRIQHSG